MYQSQYILKFTAMNSKIIKFKAKKSSNNSGPAQQNLKGQTAQIQDKLESLKAQIAMRKTIKNQQKESESNSLKATQKNKTDTSWSSSNNMNNARLTVQKTNEQVNKFLLGAKGNKNSQPTQQKSKLSKLLEQLKMEQYTTSITNKYGIKDLEKLLQLSQEQIDALKDIPVGFRIKIRKFIQEHQRNKQLQTTVQKDSCSGEDIQTIINRRKHQRVFQPISDKKIQEEEENQQQLYQNLQQIQKNKMRTSQIEQDEDVLIQSLNSVFFPTHRKSIIKKEGLNNEIAKSPNKNHVRWDSQVQQYNKQTSNFRGQKYNTKYPNQSLLKVENQKQSISPKNQIQTNNKFSYCWNCLRKISNPRQEYNARTFCGAKCRQAYNTASKLPVNNIEKVWVAEQEQQLEVIDLGIL